MWSTVAAILARTPMLWLTTPVTITPSLSRRVQAANTANVVHVSKQGLVGSVLGCPLGPEATR